MRKMIECPQCGSHELKLSERWIVVQTWTQSDEYYDLKLKKDFGTNGLSEDFDEEIDRRHDTCVDAHCLKCGHKWDYEGSVDDEESDDEGDTQTDLEKLDALTSFTFDK